MRIALRAGAVALPLCLLLPWFSGQDDGKPLKVAGWDTEPGFTAGMSAAAIALFAVSRRDLPVRLRWLPAAIMLVAVGLTLWMLPRGDRYSAPDLIAGAYVTLAVEAGLLILAVRFCAGRRA